MRFLVLCLWGLIYPVVVVLAAPFWMLKMFRRKGWGSGLVERVGFYSRDAEFEKQGAIYIHAVSVGEVLLALKLIVKWKQVEPRAHFLLVPTTATGMAVAREQAPAEVRVIYAPLDFGFLIRRVMRRFSPILVVTVESELWPNLIYQTSKMGIPLGVMNARLSPRSESRLGALKGFVSPFLERLDHVGVPEGEDLLRWQQLGVREDATVLTGNVKFDPNGVEPPRTRHEFSAMLASFPNRRIAMAISTFTGEEEYLDAAFREVGYQSVIVPRHAERRDEVVRALGGNVVLRSQFSPPAEDETLVIDSTGELRDWTAHADVAVIGKSFLEKGGQNPCEAIMAGVPVICGPHMGNFEPLLSELVASGGVQQVSSREELVFALKNIPQDQVEKARLVLGRHAGAMTRTIAAFSRSKKT